MTIERRQGDALTVNGERFIRESSIPEQPTPTQYAPELVERMVAFVRAAAKTWGPRELGRLPAMEAYEEARSILSDLPQEVDPDLIEARRAAANIGIKGFLWKQIEDGLCDDDPLVLGLRSGITRDRQLQRGEAA